MNSISKYLTEYAKIAKGKREIFRALTENKLNCVCVACDSDKSFIKELEDKCAECATQFVLDSETRGEIGKAVNIAVPCAAVGFFNSAD